MKVIEKKQIQPAVDGNYLIQVEDWSKDYPSVHTKHDQLAAYPIAKKSKYRGGIDGYEYPRRGERFRLGMCFPSEAEAKEAMQALEAGTKTLKDFVEMFDTTPNLTRGQIAYCLGSEGM